MTDDRPQHRLQDLRPHFRGTGQEILTEIGQLSRVVRERRRRRALPRRVGAHLDYGAFPTRRNSEQKPTGFEMAKKRDTEPTGERNRCASCAARVDPDDRFCRNCGAPLVGEREKNGRPRGLTGLRALGLGTVALAAVFAFLYYGRGGLEETAPPRQPISIGEVGLGGAAAPATLTSREAADQLFNQAMSAHETGDSATARQFIPMAIAAYRSLAGLDLDARYHLALLGLAANRPLEALAQTDTILAEVPDHLLALSAAATAQHRLGRPDLAAALYRRFLEAYTPDVAASRPEYLDHGRALPSRREDAERYLREHGAPQGS